MNQPKYSQKPQFQEFVYLIQESFSFLQRMKKILQDQLEPLPITLIKTKMFMKFKVTKRESQEYRLHLTTITYLHLQEIVL